MKTSQSQDPVEQQFNVGLRILARYAVFITLCLLGVHYKMDHVHIVAGAAVAQFLFTRELKKES